MNQKKGGKNRLGVKKRPHVLVLESVWSDDLSDSTSVRPFLEGWGDSLGIRVSFRSYHGHEDLNHWLQRFAKARRNPWICYIAGHGNGSRLVGLERDINITNLIGKAMPSKLGRKPDVGEKGIHIGACNIGNQAKLDEILTSTASSLSWVSGYAHAVPWTESMLCDLLFLSYLIKGRCMTYGDDERRQVLGDDKLRRQRSQSVRTVVDWVLSDFPLAKSFGFNIAERE